VSDDALRAWASTRLAFVSSEMQALRRERRAVADALRKLGLDVVMFEDLGGRDDDAQTAYLDGVARSDIYVGLIADRYGTMLPSGRSPTHEEYRQARRLGLRIAVWVAADGTPRQGDARDLVAEIQTFHTTGSWETVDDLVSSIGARVRELAAADDSPWVKLGDVVFRAGSIIEDGKTLTLRMRSRDDAVIAALEAMRPDSWGRPGDLTTSTASRAGVARVREVTSSASSANVRDLTITTQVDWSDGRRPSLAAGINGVPYEEQIEIGLRSGLFGEPVSERLGLLASTIDTSDPLAALDGLGLSHDSFEAVARLLIVERMIGGRGASRIEHLDIGPEHNGARPVELAWRDAIQYAGVEPGRRAISGERRSRSRLPA